MEGLVPNIGNETVLSQSSIRHGGMCAVPQPSRTADKLRNLLDGSFCINGGNLFNSLPKSTRNITNVETLTFKNKFDGFLVVVFQQIADEPE